MNRITTIILICLFGCSGRLQENQLQFPNPSIQSIRNLGIDSIATLFPIDQAIMNDTTIGTIPGDTIDSLNALFSGYKIYEGSNLTEDISYEWMGTYVYYRYDEHKNLISKTYDTDYKMEYQIKTEYLAKENQLIQYWNYNTDQTDTTLFQFDHKGILINEHGHIHDDKSHECTYNKTFQYNDSSQLIKVITSYQNDYEDLQQTLEIFQYNNGQLRRITKEYLYGTERGEWLPEKTFETEFFNELGLLDSTVIEQGKYRWKLYYLHYKNGVLLGN
ncbi:MAG: hypothetical protein RIC35_22875 [Marinoscillum sp.]